MNLERFIKLITNPAFRIKNKKIIKPLLQYFKEIRKINKQKLKLGKIVYEFNYFNSKDFILKEHVKIKYINQDTSHHLDVKLENVIKNTRLVLNWKHYFIIFFVLILIFVWFYNLFFNFNFKNIDTHNESAFFNHILRVSLQQLFNTTLLSNTYFNHTLFEAVLQLSQDLQLFV